MCCNVLFMYAPPGSKGDPGPPGWCSMYDIHVVITIALVCSLYELYISYAGQTLGGSSGWTRVVYLDMTDSSHQCPESLQQVTLSGKRMCARNFSHPGQPSCEYVTFSTDGVQYSQVCGRITGYQLGWTIGFHWFSQGVEIRLSNGYVYFDGISITHGPPDSRKRVVICYWV